MAVEGTKTGRASTSSTKTADQTAGAGVGGQSFQHQQTQSFARPVFGISSVMASHGNGGEQFEKLAEKIAARIKFVNEEIKPTQKYTLVKLLKQQAGLNYSALIICETSNGGDVNAASVTSAHILMVERTGDYPERLVENIGGVRYEVSRTPADALDDKYISQSLRAVAEALRINEEDIIITDATLVPNEFDTHSDVAVADLLGNAVNAIFTENTIRLSGFTGTNLAELIQSNRNARFNVSLFFNGNNEDLFDITGMPIAQDVCVALSYKQVGANNNRSINQGSDTTEILRVYGYIDFEYIGPQVVNGMMTPQRFLPNFIITRIATNTSPTPDLMMLAIASVLSLNEDMNWLQSYRPTAGKKGEVDYNDIGALNVEGNFEGNPTGFGKRYDTKSKTFDVTELSNLVQRLVVPTMAISIDIPKAGPDTWFTSVLYYIKMNNSKDAYARVADAITTMTGGVFQPNGIPMFTDVSNKIPTGFYKAKDGFRDIRHLSNYLAVANYVTDTNQTPMFIAQYTNTLANSAMPSELRASERRKFIDEMSGHTAVYKQNSDRMTFNSTFLMNMLGALKTIGFAPSFSNMGASNDMFVRRSTTDFSGAMLGADARIMNMNSNGFGNFYNPMNSYRNF